MKNIIISAALLASSAISPLAASAKPPTGELRQITHPWGYDVLVVERGSAQWDTLAFEGPNGLEVVEVHCQSKDWESYGYNANVAGLHDALVRQWCGNFY